MWNDQKGNDIYNANDLIAAVKDEYLEEEDLPFSEENKIQEGTLMNSSEYCLVMNELTILLGEQIDDLRVKPLVNEDGTTNKKKIYVEPDQNKHRKDEGTENIQSIS